MDPIINAVLKPKSIAVIGASTNPDKIGYKVVLNLKNCGYENPVYPINPDAEEILGYKCYASIKDVPYVVDLAVVTVPAKVVPTVTREAGEKGVKGLSIITSGFSEVGDHALEEEVVSIAREYGMRVIGPNIIGTLSNSDKMNASFYNYLPYDGTAALVSQSGALLIAMAAATYTRRVGFDKMISVGNMADLDFADLITYLNEDENTSCITLYIEGIADGAKFMEAARNCTKPIIALKAGTSAHGAAAAASHTGSLAGSAKVYEAAFEQSGVAQAEDLNDMFDTTLALSLQPPMKGDNLLIVTNGGGVGVLATDAAEKYGLPLKFAPEDVQTELRKHMPSFGSAKNPVDITGGAGLKGYYEGVKYAYAHPWVDGMVVLYCETSVTNPQEIAEAIYNAQKESGVSGKPIAVSFIGGERCEEATEWLIEHGIPTYDAPDLAVKALASLRKQDEMLKTSHNAPYKPSDVDSAKAREIIAGARAKGRDALTEVEAKHVFKAYGLPITPTALTHNVEEAIAMAEKIGYPVVMKIVSPDILHKSDAGAVKVNIKNEQGVRDAWKTIMENSLAYKADAEIDGLAVQEMAPWATEVIVGSVNDATFGPTLMFGLGGIFVEVMKDVTFKVAPIDEATALDMQSEIKSVKILQGARGESPRDQKALANVLAHYSYMIYDLRDEIAESDANPVIVYEEGQGVAVVDARIILTKK
ncbi:MAG: acetate--CoA ligase family protein [Anaerolineaceae bacterium]|nr:acetate--CoA ligase family protein [Anaerolineaceae bacterium]